MTTDAEPAQTALHNAEATPIAQLSPEINDPATRVVDGVITIVWPFSIVTKSIAFILAEPDFRLRREKGQVRIRFHGAAANSIAESGLGGGDEIRLSLDGAQWEKNETQTHVAGSTLEWQLEFTNRLVLRIRKPDEELARVIDLALPTTENGTTNGVVEESLQVEAQPSTDSPSTPTPPTPDIPLPNKRRASTSFESQEYSSPAFLKRAKLSYGSLFEGGFDIFDETTNKKSKSRRRTRFSLPATAWRYSSQSPSPEPEEEVEEEDVHGVAAENGDDQPQEQPSTPLPSAQQDASAEISTVTPTRPAMVDEGCQTAELEFPPSANVDVSAEARPGVLFPQATPTPFPRERRDGQDAIHSQTLELHPGLDSNVESSARILSDFSRPLQMDHGVGFGFGGPSDSVVYPSRMDFLVDPNSAEGSMINSNELPRTEAYPSVFLEDGQLTEHSMDAHSSLHSQDGDIEPHTLDQPHLAFPPQQQFYPQFSESMLPNNLGTWPTPNPFFSNSLQNPVEIPSSPTKERSVVEESYPTDHLQDGEVEDRRGEEEEEEVDTVQRDNIPDTGAEEQISSDVDEEYRDGGDRPGDDYDLRNYDRAHDDDDDVPSSDEEQNHETDDPDEQVIDPEEEGDNASEDADAESEEQMYYEQREPSQAYDEYENEDEEEYASQEMGYEDDECEDEEGYDDEEEEEEEEEEDAGPTPPPKEPVFISLLSDSEDEEEDNVGPVKSPEPPRVQEPGPALEPEPQMSRNEEVSEESEEDEEPESASEGEQSQASEDQGPSSPAGESSSGLVQLDKAEDKMEIDDDQGSPAEEPEAMESGDAMPSKDNGNQSPRTSPPPLQAAPHMQATEPGATREEGQSAASSMERGDPADANPDELGKEAAKSTHMPPMAAPATAQDVGGDEQGQDEEHESQAEISGQIHLATHEVVISSGDAMEVDATEEIRAPDVQDHPDDSGTNVTNEMEVDSHHQEGSGATADGSTTSMPNHEQATNLVQESAEIATTPGSGSPLSKVVDQGVPQTGEITEAAPESQGSGTGYSPDATTSKLLATTDEQRPVPSELERALHVSQLGAGEGNLEASRDQQLAANTPFSPPPTQVPQTQTQLSKDIDEPLLSQISNATSTHEHDDEKGHLPTPFDTQLDTQPDAGVRAHPPAEQQESQQQQDQVQIQAEENDDDEVGPDDQIMAEFLQHSPGGGESAQHTNPAGTGDSPTQADDHVGVRDEERQQEPQPPTESPKQGSDKTITVKSLRSRGHKSTRSGDTTKTKASERDPSVLLARQTPAKLAHKEDMENSPPSPLRVSRRKADLSDPSIALAKATTASHQARGRGSSIVSSSPPGTLRITRSKTDHSDPSVRLARDHHHHPDPSLQLAKAGPSTTSRTAQRRHQTPELPPRETRATSKGSHRDYSPETLLKSPSVADSTTHHDDHDDNANALRLQLIRSLRTSLPDYLPLKTLRTSFNKTADFLAVATATPASPQRPKGGPRDYMLSLNLTDPSAAPTSIAVANLFRPHQSSLPLVQAGDVVLLRRMHVVSMKSRGFGLRTGDASAWAVFERKSDEMLPQIRGPPVEVTDEEVRYAEGLRRWWALLDGKAREKIEKASRKVTEASKEH